MREGTVHGLALDTARVDSEPPAGRAGVEAQTPPAEDDKSECFHAGGASQSSRTAIVISRISRRSSSWVGRPKYQ